MIVIAVLLWDNAVFSHSRFSLNRHHIRLVPNTNMHGYMLRDERGCNIERCHAQFIYNEVGLQHSKSGSPI